MGMKFIVAYLAIGVGFSVGVIIVDAIRTVLAIPRSTRAKREGPVTRKFVLSAILGFLQAVVIWPVLVIGVIMLR